MGIPHTPRVSVRWSSKGRQGLGEHEAAWPGAYSQLSPRLQQLWEGFWGQRQRRGKCVFECRRQVWASSHPGPPLPTCVLFVVLL